ncbi:hypothetical protein [Wolbachia endosymbiont (group A) of Apoderus coryli]|nr:hypothetical protein [Wolbachia endosymbiont (group A) of Apoderus coryli]
MSVKFMEAKNAKVILTIIIWKGKKESRCKQRTLFLICSVAIH